MKKAYLFPGQGSQFCGMGKDLYQRSEIARKRFEQADQILGFSLSQIMFEGTAEDLKQTRVTQPAIFCHSVILAEVLEIQPDMVAGHSLGEFSALVVSKVFSFEEGLRLVSLRAQAMQQACDVEPSTMAAILGLSDEKVEEICRSITDTIVVPANYNSPGQLVISGTIKGVEKAIELCKAAGAKRAVQLPVSGAFHSPLMESARAQLAQAIEKTTFNAPICPVYQNVSAKAETDPAIIRQNLLAQLTAPVKWTQSIQAMVADGATEFIEIGPGKVLQGLVKSIAPEIPRSGFEKLPE
ncbi:MAG: ACP S-malonyltransferase [Bacteroidia bacterium]|nr:ACP S-malonyltransferase [Bacteroidia bacterium]MDW8302708.1 ACP S-malonyltransferase [Bacteroidia bacterium]